MEKHNRIPDKNKGYFCCSNCGSVVLSDDKTCPKCGDDVSEIIQPQENHRIKKSKKRKKKKSNELKVCPHCRQMQMANDEKKYCSKCGFSLDEGPTDKVLKFMGGPFMAFVVIGILINKMNHDYPDAGGYLITFVVIACIIFVIIHNYSKTHA